ncbi:glycosyltransferase [Pseudomonas sp. NPDC007930]|uniref:glycosyltransferase n=1 Tax=Pseudomonas sp. NPDC007930 TaxID=3364417 RepID=UPI0036F18465
MRVAIILASYNGNKFLKAQINSILWQSHRDVSLYIHDDGSTDGTLDILEAFRSNPRITVLQDNVITGSASGNFIHLLRTIPLDAYDYIGFSDQDDIWDPDKISRALAVLKESGADGYSSDLITFGNYKHRPKKITKGGRPARYDYLFQGASAGCTYLFSQMLAMKVIATLEQFSFSDLAQRSHDWVVYAIARHNNYKWVHDDNCTVFYRQHGKNVYGAGLGWRGSKARFNKVKEGWYRNNILWNAMTVLGLQDDPWVARVRRNSYLDKVYLAMSVNLFRRKLRDRIALAIMLLIGAF